MDSFERGELQGKIPEFCGTPPTQLRTVTHCDDVESRRFKKLPCYFHRALTTQKVSSQSIKACETKTSNPMITELSRATRLHGGNRYRAITIVLCLISRFRKSSYFIEMQDEIQIHRHTLYIYRAQDIYVCIYGNDINLVENL